MASRRQQKEATAQQLFEVAVELFRTRGYHETTVEAITRAAGVAKGTFFAHFPTKEAVLGHLGQMQMARLTAAITAEAGFGALSYREQVRLIYRVLGEGIEGQRELVLMTAVELLRRRDQTDTATHGLDAFDDLLAGLAEVAQARGELRRDAGARELARLTRALYFMSVFEWLQQEQRPFFEVAARQLDLLLDGIADSR